MNSAVGYYKNNFFLNDPQWAIDFAPNGKLKISFHEHGFDEVQVRLLDSATL